MNDVFLSLTGLLCSSDNKCNCDIGYQWSFTYSQCIDLNKCDTSSYICDNSTSNGTCFNLNSTNFMCSCLPGYQWSSTFKYCVDINECLPNSHSKMCTEPNTICINEYGSYVCKCATGFQNVSGECVDLNECLDGGVCNNSTFCNNRNGFYECCVSESDSSSSISSNETSECYTCGYQYFQPDLNVNNSNMSSNFSEDGTENKVPQVSARIVGGVEAVKNSWPWLVSIGINYKYNLYIG